MFRKSIVAAAVGAAFVVPVPAVGADDAQVQKIRDELKDLKEGYETRIRQLEQRLEQTEQRPAASAAPAQSAPASPNAFISVESSNSPPRSGAELLADRAG